MRVRSSDVVADLIERLGEDVCLVVPRAVEDTALEVFAAALKLGLVVGKPAVATSPALGWSASAGPASSASPASLRGTSVVVVVVVAASAADA